MRGFTLLELSIVLIIIGLMFGGVMMGQNLMRSADLKSLATQTNTLENAMQTFLDKYGYLPGDMPNATTIWGAEDGGDGLGTDCTGLPSDGTPATCNGNGNGQIQQNASDPFRYENFRAWQHLANAGMVPGSYTGINHTPSATLKQAVPGENVPVASMADVGFTLLWKPTTTTGWSGWYQIDYDRNIMTVGRGGDIETRIPFLSVSEMQAIDTKLDDGIPSSGKIMTYNNSIMPDCVSSDVVATAVYINAVGSDDNKAACAYIVILGL